MCVGCVKVNCPDRGNLCLETGSYLLNFQKCASCNSKETIQIQNRHTDEDEEEECVVYHHVCAVCDHVIAEHQYEFRIDGEYQEYSMVCILCGRAEDSINVCAVCDHVIAEHQYEFRIDGEYQEYSMVCILCGRAEDSISILPVDPNKQLNLF